MNKSRKNSNLENKLAKALKELKLQKPISVDEIKSFIWSETDHMDLARLFQYLTENETDDKKVDEIMNLLQEAWNNFPHKILGGLSPAEKIQHKSPPKNIKSPQVTKRVHNLFPDKYPNKVKFTKIGEVEWEFDFPGYYYDVCERLFQLDEEDISAEEYERDLKTLLRICPEAFDVAKELAEFYIYNKELTLAREILEKTISHAKTYIPETFKVGKDLIIWGYLDNRPFLRLLASYAQFIEETESEILAIPLYEEILLFNPNDNQGIRELLSTAYLKTNKLEDLVKLSAKYPDDMIPGISFGNILALFKFGRIKEAEKQLKKVGKYQQHIIEELLKSKHLKPVNLMKDRVTVGGEDEAYYYWQSQGRFWTTTKGAKEFLQTYYKRMTK